MTRAARWALSSLLTLTVILLPFVLFRESMDAWTLSQLESDAGTWPIALSVVTLLTVDLLLPVPSSLVSTLAGALLGVPAAFLASLIGMTLACQLGYALGRHYGTPLVRRLISEDELARVSKQVTQRGIWAFAIMRPIPVLAEASAFWAGVMQIHPLRFSAVTLLANAVVSYVYAEVGAAALPAESVVLVFAIAIALPVCGLIVGFTRRHAASSLESEPRVQHVD